MRPLSFLTLTASIILSLPMMLWALGASPAVSLFLHGAAIVLTTRMFYVMGRYGASSVGDALWVGGFSGLIGATLTQLLLHMSNVHSPLSTAFSGYGQLGAVMFRLDMLSAWWPYALIFWSGAAYASWGAVVWFWAKRRKNPVPA